MLEDRHWRGDASLYGPPPLDVHRQLRYPPSSCAANRRRALMRQCSGFARSEDPPPDFNDAVQANNGAARDQEPTTWTKKELVLNWTSQTTFHGLKFLAQSTDVQCRR